jgi:hypothetical protein
MRVDARRNDPCPCGSGRKYKRCCIERERPLTNAEPDRQLAESADAGLAAAALTSSLRAVVGKDSTALGDRLSRFADLLRASDTLANVRFDDDAFAHAVARSLSRLGRARGPNVRAHLFQLVMRELGDRRAARKLRDRLARAVSAATLNLLDREAVAAAVICLEPVLGKRAVAASASPTLEVIFNVQLEAWMERLDPRALELKVAIRESF